MNNMKHHLKTILTLLLFLAFFAGKKIYALDLQAPTDHYIGVKIGLGASNLLYTDEIVQNAKETKYRASLLTGVDIIYDLDFKGRFYSLFVQAGISLADVKGIYTGELIRLQYAVFSVGLKIYVYKDVYIGCAPYLGILMNAQKDSANYKAYFRNDFGIIFRFGSFFWLMKEVKMILEIEGRMGFINVYNMPGNNRKLYGILFYAGLSVNI